MAACLSKRETPGPQFDLQVHDDDFQSFTGEKSTTPVLLGIKKLFPAVSRMVSLGAPFVRANQGIVRLPELLLITNLLGDIARDLSRAAWVLYRRDRQRDVDKRPVRALALRFEMVNPFALSQWNANGLLGAHQDVMSSPVARRCSQRLRVGLIVRRTSGSDLPQHRLSRGLRYRGS